MAVSEAARGPVPAPAALPATVQLVPYSRPFQAALADDFERLPPGSPGRTAITDYGQLRRAVCVTEGWRQPVCLTIQAAGGATP